MGTLTLAGGRTLGGQMSIVITVVYVAAFYATLIVTPALGYLAVRYLRDMPHVAKVWTLAGLLAGVRGCMYAADAFPLIGKGPPPPVSARTSTARCGHIWREAQSGVGSHRDLSSLDA